MSFHDVMVFGALTRYRSKSGYEENGNGMTMWIQFCWPDAWCVGIERCFVGLGTYPGEPGPQKIEDVMTRRRCCGGEMAQMDSAST